MEIVFICKLGHESDIKMYAIENLRDKDGERQMAQFILVFVFLFLIHI